jgi:hypothetical protein
MTDSDHGDSRPRLRYLATNENLLAIRHGLAIGPDDDVLAVAAAGDQAFALLEFARSVEVVDANPKQLHYVARQAEFLKHRDFQSFLRPQVLLLSDPVFGYDVEQLAALNSVGLAQRQRYFTPARLNAIRQKLGDFVLSGSTVLEAASKRSFDKVYLTNIIGYLDSDFTEGSLLFLGANRLKIGGLVYLANPVGRPTSLARMKKLGFEPDTELTGVARALEPNWKPDVFHRVT